MLVACVHLRAFTVQHQCGLSGGAAALAAVDKLWKQLRRMVHLAVSRGVCPPLIAEECSDVQDGAQVRDCMLVL